MSSSACCKRSRRTSFSCFSSSIRWKGAPAESVPAIPNYVNPSRRKCPAKNARLPLINYENINEVLEHKTGPARSFGLKLKSILREARQLWRDERAGKATDFQAEVERFEDELTIRLRPRILKDEDNQRLLGGIGLQHDRGRVLLFLHDPDIEPTNNRGERALRGSVIVRKLSHGSKNERGAQAFAGFTSVIQTAAKKRGCSIIDALQNLFQSKSNKPPTEAHPPPG